MLVWIEDQVFLPADFIICRGDIGNEMYFLREGFAGVFTCHFAKKGGEQVSLDPGWLKTILKQMWEKNQDVSMFHVYMVDHEPCI